MWTTLDESMSILRHWQECQLDATTILATHKTKKETGLSETIQRRQGKETRDTYYMIMGNKHSSV